MKKNHMILINWNQFTEWISTYSICSSILRKLVLDQPNSHKKDHKHVNPVQEQIPVQDFNVNYITVMQMEINVQQSFSLLLGDNSLKL